MFVIDSHCDSIQNVDSGRADLINAYNYSNKYPQLQFVAMMTGWPGDPSEEHSFRRTARYTGLFFTEMAYNSDKVVPVKTYADIEKAFSEGKHAALLSMESATGLMGSEELLRKFHAAGLRVVGLTWLSNSLAKSNRVFEDGEEDTGLSDLGRKIVETGNELGIIWDVSHLSDAGFWQLSELSKKPVIATHSNFRALCSHNRNLTDDMAKEIIKKGGMIGLNLACCFITEKSEDATVEALMKHLEHCLELGGENNIGFGCDIDGISRLPKPLTKERSIHDQLIEFMQKHYSEALTEKVAYKNYMEFLKKYL